MKNNRNSSFLSEQINSITKCPAVDLLERAKDVNKITHLRLPSNNKSFWEKIGDVLNPFKKCEI